MARTAPLSWIFGKDRCSTSTFAGSRILELLKGGSAQAEIVDQIVLEFGVSRDRAENDAKKFLQTLEKLT